MAERKQKDPTISTGSVDKTEYPEGTHPVAPPSETSFAPNRNDYKDNPDKPDPTTVAQVEVLTSDVDKPAE